VTRVEINGADHAAAWNVGPKRNPLGNPTAVAFHLKDTATTETTLTLIAYTAEPEKLEMRRAGGPRGRA